MRKAEQARKEMEGKKHGKWQADVIGQAGFARRDRTFGTRPVVHCRWIRDFLADETG
jgi:hypothetical protein